MKRIAIAVDRSRQRVLGLLGLGLLTAFLIALSGCGDDGGEGSGSVPQSDSGNGGSAAWPTPTAAPDPNEIRLDIAPGEPLRIQASLHLAGPESLVAGVQNDITFDPALPIAARPNGRPDCAYDPASGKNGSAFGFQPPGCSLGVDCTAVRAVVLSFGDTDPIPDGTVLYSCGLEASGAESGRAYAFPCSYAYGATPEGLPVPVDCPDVEITIP
jgi:hypothetical protein